MLLLTISPTLLGLIIGALFIPTLWLTARIVVSVVISEWWQKFITWDYAYPLLFTIGFTLAGALIGWIGGVEAARHN